MDKQSFLELSTKVAEGRANEAELTLYNNYLNLYAAAGWDEIRMGEASSLKEELHARINLEMGSMPKTIPFYRRPAFLYLAAACIALIVSGIAALFFNPHAGILDLIQAPNAIATKNDIPPGRNTATLTLANGEVIHLDTNKTSVVVADSLKNLVPSELGMASVSTPRGGTYQVTLPDGTKVWLNADSKITFPAQFSGSKREVSIEGEIYFEVAHNKAKPFIVKGGGQTIKVLGTHFNISSYPDEGVTKTTLIEGSVSVTSLRGRTEASRGKLPGRGPSTTPGEAAILKPGQQSVLGPDQHIRINPVNTQDAIAWKNGEFQFEKQTLAGIMREVSRWYDVEVDYDASLAQKRFSGTISRYDNISKVLDFISSTNELKFKIEGRKVSLIEN